MLTLLQKEVYMSNTSNDMEKKNFPSVSEAAKALFESYLHERYGITIDELDNFYGMKLCKFVTRLREYDFNFIDAYGSATVKYVTDEMNTDTNYDFSNIDFEPDDVVIDIGANIGIVSIYLAKRYPFIKIYSYEPVKLNYENLKRNIVENKIPEGIITAERFAVNGTGEPVNIASCIGNSGGSMVIDGYGSGYIQKNEDKNIPAITLKEIIEKHGIKKVKLLKIDCEGAEYDIFNNTPAEYLGMIENLRGEFHEDYSKTKGKNITKLIKHCQQYIPNVNVVRYDTHIPD